MQEYLMIRTCRLRPFVRSAALASALLAVIFIACMPSLPINARQASEQVDDVSGEYHFLSPEDTLALLEEEGRLKGYVDVYQGDQESDNILSYPLTIGSRQKNHVEFKTGKIHEKYYRFSGTVERGAGRGEAAPDYLRLVGTLETITENSITGKESVDRRQVVLKSKGKSSDER